MRKVVRVYQEWISQEDKPVFMREPEEDRLFLPSGAAHLNPVAEHVPEKGKEEVRGVKSGGTKQHYATKEEGTLTDFFCF